MPSMWWCCSRFRITKLYSASVFLGMIPQIVPSPKTSKTIYDLFIYLFFLSFLNS